MRCLQSTLVALAVLAFPAIVLPQEEQASEKRWQGRVYVNVNGGFQTASPSFGYTQTTQLWEEQASAALDIPGEPAVTFDVSGGVRLVQNFGVGLTYSRYDVERTGSLTTTIPHPFFFEESGTAQRDIPLSRTEDVVHIQAVYKVPVTRKLQIGMFGGPSYFRCQDQLVREFQLEGDFTANFDWIVDFAEEPVLKLEEDTAWGFHGGVDVAYLFSRYVGLAGTVRYSHATHDTVNYLSDTRNLEDGALWGGAGTDISATVPMDHGGLQLLGGVSFRF